MSGTTRRGLLSEAARREREIDLVWTKGLPVPGLSPAMWRKDRFGSLIKRSDYGNYSSAYGWEIDHILATASGGRDTLENKEPLQWQNNRSKGDMGLSELYGTDGMLWP